MEKSHHSSANTEFTSKLGCEPSASSANVEQEVAALNATTTTVTDKLASSFITLADPEHRITGVPRASCVRFHVPVSVLQDVYITSHGTCTFVHVKLTSHCTTLPTHRSKQKSKASSALYLGSSVVALIISIHHFL